MKLSGLTVRIYLVLLAQIGAVLAALVLVHWLTFDPTRNPHFMRDARFAAKLSEDALRAPGHARSESLRIYDDVGGFVSVYAADGTLLLSNAAPALPALEDSARARVLGGEAVFTEGPPPIVNVPVVLPDGPGYLRFRPIRPPKPPPLATWGIVTALVVSALASVLLARSLARPLQILQKTAGALGSGDLTARAALNRNDELGAVGTAFDDMAGRLSELLRAEQELIANVSHELRTPLARIRVALDIAAEGDADTARESLVDITDDLAELERLVSDVLQSARLDLAQGRARTALPALRVEPVDVALLFDKSVARLRAAQPSRAIEASRPASLPIVQGDPMLLRRALENLLDNAAAYSAEGTTIHAEAVAEPGFVLLRVRDHGIGIAEEHLPLVTQPFFRADPSRTRRTGGIGLGLSLTSRIASAHHGELQIESSLGVGTSVSLKLPVGSAEG